MRHLLTLSLLFTLACGDSHGGPDGGSSLPDGGGAGPDTAGEDVPADRPIIDQAGGCFEIFPDGEGLTSGYHVTPTVYERLDLVVGETFQFNVGYYNFCAAPNAIVIESGWLDEAVDDAFSIVEVPESVNSDASQSRVRLSLTPPAAGSYSATFRMRLHHGYYDIVIDAETVEAEE